MPPRLLLILTALMLPACAAGRRDDPLAGMLDRSQGQRVRWAAARQAEAEMFDHPDRLAALRRLVTEPGHPMEYRVYAVEQLIRLDETAAMKFLADAILLLPDRPTLQHVCRLAADRQWTGFTPALVRSLAQTWRDVEDKDRPEQAALLSLNPRREPQDIARSVLTDPAGDIRHRVAAWTLLCRIEKEPIALLESLTGDDPLIQDLRAGWRELHILPTRMETIAWLRMLRSGLVGPLWSDAMNAVQSLSPEQQHNLQLRHIPILVFLARHHPQVLGRSISNLKSQIPKMLEAREHHLKSPAYEGARPSPQTFAHWQDQLCWADLATTWLMLKRMEDRTLVASWFVQADGDFKDETSEYGGLLRAVEAGRAVAQPYEPMVRRHDLIYIPPKELILDGYTALAHYHFHVQSYDNSRFAGPGSGDLRHIAQTQQLTGLVLTFIDHDRLNVDLYFAPDVVIDLGTLRR